MKIRSITCFYDPTLRNGEQHLALLAGLARKGKQLFESAGYPVQTLRLATTPFSSMKFRKKDFLDWVVTLEGSALANGFNYVSLGPALPEKMESFELISQIMQATRQVFLSTSLITQSGEISIPAVNASAAIIQKLSSMTSDGFKNLNFCASANVKPFGPFFPSSYSSGKAPAFSIAVEGADLAVNAFSKAASLAKARKALLSSINTHTQILNEICAGLCKSFPVKFQGFDFSLAPYPKNEISIGYALESLGVEKLGNSGSLAVAAFLAATLDEGKWKKAGFNGLMLPMLEDSTLAQRSIDGILSMKDMLMFSAVCGTGLDTIPLPGDISAEQIAAILLDIAFLSVRLSKPLTARLMPVPGKKAGDLTEFQFEYFANGRILDPQAGSLGSLFQSTERVKITPRK